MTCTPCLTPKTCALEGCRDAAFRAHAATASEVGEPFIERVNPAPLAPLPSTPPEVPVALRPLSAVIVDTHGHNIGPVRTAREAIAQALRRDDVRQALWRALWSALPEVLREPKRFFHIILNAVADYIDPSAVDPQGAPSTPS